jgi:hypothetical protein
MDRALVAKIVQEQQVVSQDTSEQAGERAVRPGDLEIIHQALGGFGQDPEIVLQGFDSYGVLVRIK